METRYYEQEVPATAALNRTIVGWKPDDVGEARRLIEALNRTIVGWKRNFAASATTKGGSFKSHHSGMETGG